MKFFLLAVFALVAFASAAEDTKVVDLTADTFKEAVAKDNHFVMFFAPWCGHCKRLHPTWDDLAEKLSEKKEAVVAKVDCTVETSLCSDQDVTGYPTLKFFKKDGDEKEAEKYRGGRDINSLHKYVGKQLGFEVEEAVIEAEDAKVEKGLYILSEKSFAKHIAKGEHFIKFYAPWCGHCKKLAPTWEELAEAFADDKVVKVAKLDCTEAQSICQEQEVKGYPTLVYYKDGKKVENYRGARNLNELKDFLKSMQEEKKPAADKKENNDKKEEAKEVESDVVVLDKDNFESTTKSGLTFVKFFAPWCGHCKRLAPTWDELAAKFKDNEAVTIAKVDCTSDDNKNKKVCNDNGVNGFPTLKLFKDGAIAEEYKSKRELAELEKFVTNHLSDKKDEL